MDEYDTLFSSAMQELVAKGLDFQALGRETLKEILGEISSGILFTLLGKEGSKRPMLFVEEMRKYFGATAPIVCNLVATRGAEMIPGGRLIPEVAAFEAVKRGFESSEVESTTRKSRFTITEALTNSTSIETAHQFETILWSDGGGCIRSLIPPHCIRS